MSRANRSAVWAAIALGALVLGTGVGIQRLFGSRFVHGDVYPPYSSWSSAPEGTRILYDALAASGVASVERSAHPLAQIGDAWAGTEGTALVLCGVALARLRTDGPWAESVDRLVRGGLRVVVALDDARAAAAPPEKEAGEATAERDAPGPGDAAPGAAVSRWGFEVQQLPAPAPGELDRNSELRLVGLAGSWVAIEADASGVLAVERRSGLGSLVLAASSAFLTNRGQVDERRPELILALLGGSRHVLFDETHLGIVRQPSLVGLARRHRLHGVAIAALVTLVLAVWRGATGLVPALEKEMPSVEVVPGSQQGLVSLLQRGVPPDRLLRTCVERWSASLGSDAGVGPALALADADDPVAGYHRLSELLGRKARRSIDER